MKNIIKIPFLLLPLLGIGTALVTSCSDEYSDLDKDYKEFEVTTLDTLEVGFSYADVEGIAVGPFLGSKVSLGIQYSTSSKMDKPMFAETHDVDGKQKFSTTLPYLSPDTKYYYRAYCSGTKDYGSIKSFKTKAFKNTMSCDTLSVGSFQSTISIFFDNVDSKDYQYVKYYVLYSTKDQKLDTLNSRYVSVGRWTSATTINSLQYNTKYYYCGAVNVGEKWYYTPIKNFTTKDFKGYTFADWTSTNKTHGSTGYKEIDFTVSGSMILSFNYNVSSERNCDIFSAILYYPSGTWSTLLTASGSISDTYSRILSNPGTYKLRLQYKKDGSISNGLDQVTVSNIVVQNY